MNIENDIRVKMEEKEKNKKGKKINKNEMK